MYKSTRRGSRQAQRCWGKSPALQAAGVSFQSETFHLVCPVRSSDDDMGMSVCSNKPNRPKRPPVAMIFTANAPHVTNAQKP